MVEVLDAGEAPWMKLSEGQAQIRTRQAAYREDKSEPMSVACLTTYNNLRRQPLAYIL